jgi:hypothetical protein
MDELYDKITRASTRFLSPVTSEQMYKVLFNICAKGRYIGCCFFLFATAIYIKNSTTGNNIYDVSEEEICCCFC